MQETQYKIMTETPVRRLVLKLSVPTVVSMLATAVYNMVDTYFVSHLGTAASAAVGVVFSLMAMIQTVGFTLGTGAGSWISRLLGSQDADTADEVAGTALFWGLLRGLLLTALGLIFSDLLMRLLGASETVAPFARSYAFWILLFAPVMILSYILNNLLRAEGHTLYSMIGLLAGGLINCILDPILISVADLGIAGAAIATAIGQTAGLLLLVAPYLLKKTTLHPKFSWKAIFSKQSFRITLYGLPSLFRQGLASLSAVFLNHAAARYGDVAVSAVTIANKVFMILFSFCLGIGQGYMPVAGFNYSAEKMRRLRDAARFSLFISQGAVLILGGLVALFADRIITAFLPQEEVVRIGAETLRFACIGLQFVPIGILCNMTFQAVGKVFLSSFTASLRQGILFVPFIFLLPQWFDLTGVQITQSAADVLNAVIAVPLWLWFIRRTKEKSISP